MRVECIASADKHFCDAEWSARRGQLAEAIDRMGQAAAIFELSDLSGSARLAWLRLAEFCDAAGEKELASAARKDAGNIDAYDFRTEETS